MTCARKAVVDGKTRTVEVLRFIAVERTRLTFGGPVQDVVRQPYRHASNGR